MKKCSKCGEQKPEQEFYFNRRTQRRVAYCIACDKLMKKAYRETHRDQTAVANRRWQLANPDKVKATQQRWHLKHPGRGAELAKQWHRNNREKALAQGQARVKALKDVVYNAYGGYRCACCGEITEQFLSIDHINNDGANHRKGVNRRKMYHWLKKHGFPAGFQILCMNCNFGKARNNGVCPHQASEGSTTSRKAYTQAGGNAEPPAKQGKI